MKQLNGKNDTAIELLRVVACFFVICIHLSVGLEIDECLSKSSLLLTCLRADAVAFFWMITGAFLYQRGKYYKVLNSTFRKVFIPMIALILFIYLFEGFIFYNESIIDSIAHTPQEFYNMITCVVMKWVSPVAYSGHLWYLFTYFLVIIIFPVMKPFVDCLDSDDKLQKMFLIGSFAFLFWNDLSGNAFASFNHSATGALLPAMIIVFLGHILYKNKSYIIDNYKCHFFILVFIFANALRALLYGLTYINIGEEAFKVLLFWFSSFSMVTVPSLFFFMCWVTNKIKNQSVHRVISFLGSHTFSIYLLHELVIGITNKYGYIDALKSYFASDGTILKMCLYDVIGGGTVFVLCLIISIIISLFMWLGKKVISRCFNRSE